MTEFTGHNGEPLVYSDRPQESFNFGSVSIREQPQLFAKLPALAERLGVKPVEGNRSASVVLNMGSKDGRSYDIFDLMAALLDRMDEVTK